MGYTSHRHRKKLMAGALAAGLLGHELLKPEADADTVAAKTVQHVGPAKNPERRSMHRTSEHDSELTQAVPEDFNLDFRTWGFQTSDLLDFNRQYKPVEGFEEQGWNPNGAYDEYLKSEFAKDTRLQDEYADIAGHIEIEADNDWITFSSEDQYGGINVSYQMVPPSEADSRWGVTEYSNDANVESTYYSPTPYESVGDMKDHILRLVKGYAYTEAAKYRLETPSTE